MHDMYSFASSGVANARSIMDDWSRELLNVGVVVSVFSSI